MAEICVNDKGRWICKLSHSEDNRKSRAALANFLIRTSDILAGLNMPPTWDLERVSAYVEDGPCAKAIYAHRFLPFRVQLYIGQQHLEAYAIQPSRDVSCAQPERKLTTFCEYFILCSETGPHEVVAKAVSFREGLFLLQGAFSLRARTCILCGMREERVYGDPTDYPSICLNCVETASAIYGVELYDSALEKGDHDPAGLSKLLNDYGVTEEGAALLFPFAKIEKKGGAWQPR